MIKVDVFSSTAPVSLCIHHHLHFTGGWGGWGGRGGREGGARDGGWEQLRGNSSEERVLPSANLRTKKRLRL